MPSVYRITRRMKKGAEPEKASAAKETPLAPSPEEKRETEKKYDTHEYPIFFETGRVLGKEKDARSSRREEPKRETKKEAALEERVAPAAPKEAPAPSPRREETNAELEEFIATVTGSATDAPKEEDPFPPQEETPPETPESSKATTLEFISGASPKEEPEKPADPAATISFENLEEEIMRRAALKKAEAERAEAEEAERNAEEASVSGAAGEEKRADPAELFKEESRPAAEEGEPAPAAEQEQMEKLHEVYGGKNSVSPGQEPAKKDYDEVTSLLMEVFGGDAKKKKKHKKDEAEAETVPRTRLSEIFEPGTTSETPIVPQGAPGTAPAEEGTREFDPAAIEAALSDIRPEPEEAPAAPPVNDEVKMSDADNPYLNTFEDTTEYAEERRKGLPEEFTAPEQYDEFAEHLRGRAFRSLVSTVWGFLLIVALFYLESATYTAIPHPVFLTPNAIRYVYQLIDLQLVLLSAVLILSSLGEGAKALFSGKPDRNSLTFVVFLIAGAHPIARLFLEKNDAVYYGVIAAVFAFFTCIANFVDAKRIYRAFRIAGSKRTKLVAERVPTDSAEMDSFREYLPAEPRIFTVKKANFIEKFFEKTEAKAPGTAYGTLILLAILLSAAFAGYFFWETRDADLAIERFVTCAMLSLPLVGVFTVTVPFSHLSRKAEKRDSAIISPGAAEEYAKADLVSFTDKEIFPPKSVKVTTIRTYGDTRIDNAILYAAMIFQKLGGPLSLVFKKTLSGVVQEIREDFDFLEITADGMCARIDGKEVFVGNKDYLLSYAFGYPKDEKDEAFEARAGKIMYMVIGKSLAAKFYIRYSISKRFTKTMNALYKAGIYAAVKTCDPNIDSDLFKALMRNKKFPAGIVKTTDAMKDAPTLDSCDSGIVCCSTISNMLHTFVLSEKLLHLIRLGSFLKILASFVGVGVMAFLYFTGSGVEKINPLFVLIYQLLWLIPGVIPSLTE